MYSHRKGSLLITKGKIITPFGEEQSDLYIHDGIIESIASGLIRVRNNEEVLDVKGKYILPGFIDPHFYGCVSKAIDDPETVASNLQVIARTLPQWGVTGFLISPAVVSHETRLKVLSVLAQTIPKLEIGARVLGIHLEGPFLNPDLKGGFPVNSLENPSWNIMQSYLDAARGFIKIVTLSPELEGAIEIADNLYSCCVIPSLGHSNAHYELAKIALEGSFDLVTHLFNAMGPLNHRVPGVIGACLENARKAMIICDEIHVHPMMVRLAVKVLGTEHIILCTDAIPGTGKGNGNYVLYQQEIIVENEKATLSNGTLAGSVLTMDKAVKNILSICNLNLSEIISCSSRNIAKTLRRPEFGKLEVGAAGDVVILDTELNPFITIVGGEIAYRR